MLKITPINFNQYNNQDRFHNLNSLSSLNYNIKMQSQPSCDTVSFKAAAKLKTKLQNRFTKTILDTFGERSTKTHTNPQEMWKDAVTTDLAKKVLARYKKPHEKCLNTLLSLRIPSNNGTKIPIADILSTSTERRDITLLHRLKSKESLGEKSATRGWSNEESLTQNMDDISGFGFIAENSSALSKYIKIIKGMIDEGYQVVDYEYHRLPPKYKKSKIVESFDSLNQECLQKMKEMIKENNQPISVFKDIDSKAGYSGLHITMLDKNGFKHEFQFMIKSMANVKRPEGLIYKAKSGKGIPDKYAPLLPRLLALKPPARGEKLPEINARIIDEVVRYDKEAYIDALSHPYSLTKDGKKILSPDPQKYPLIYSTYDLNEIDAIMVACDEKAATVKVKK